MRFYSDPSREHDRWSLTDAEVFWLIDGELDFDGEPCKAGFYYQYGFPGCLPDSEPFGPYASEEEAIKACQEYNS